MARFTKRRFFSVCLIGLLVVSSYAQQPNDEDHSVSLPAALVSELEQWTAQTDFWRLVTRGESILARIEISEKASPAVEAWVCGTNHICLTTGLRRFLNDSELEAVIAHEIGHIVIPRKPNSHVQLWETQCDIFAAALLRDHHLVKSMLISVDRACPACRDQLHLAPLERAALLDHCAELPLEKVSRLDALRASEFKLPTLNLAEVITPNRTMP